MKKYLWKLFLCMLLVNLCLIAAETQSDDCIVVEKRGVTHRFVRSGGTPDNFCQNFFPTWENDTFDAFEMVKDDQGIAIDVGAWIGTTAIWLSKNFYHVIALDADNQSVKSLERNLKASDCSNVTICNLPISNVTQNVIFGPRGGVLNQSMSYIKPSSNSIHDYIKKSITFKQLIHDYVYANDNISSHKISFIKCDIEGGEEDILEDILHFAYNNNCKVFMSFHYSWWKSKNINDFKYLFDHFNANSPNNDACEYIRRNPSGSVLFEPKEYVSGGDLVKKNMPALIIGYNQLTFIRNMVKQLEKYTSDIIIVDNNSSYPHLLDYYKNEFKYTLLRQKHNYGYRVYQRQFIQNLVGDIYILTDPDLTLNPNLPNNFLQELIGISNYYNAQRVGFALDIFFDDLRTDVTYRGKSIQEWESNFWKNPLPYTINPNLKLYRAVIDTTFCLIHRRHHPNINIRVAGDFTCDHIPWHKDFRNQLEEGEYEYYFKNNNTTNWYGTKNGKAREGK